MADAEKKADAKAEGQAAEKKGGAIGKIVLIIILLIVIAIAIPYFVQIGKYKEALSLYEAEKYKEAHAQLLALENAFPISAFQGKQIRRTLGMCQAELAADLALSLNTPEGYRQALDMLTEAQKLAPDSTEIKAQIEEYRQYTEAATPEPALENAPDSDEMKAPE